MILFSTYRFNNILTFFVSTTILLFTITVQTKDTQNFSSNAHISDSTTIKNEIQNLPEKNIDSIDSDLKTIYFFNNFKFNEENVTDNSTISLIYPRKLKIVSTLSDKSNVSKDHKRQVSAMRNAVRTAAREGLAAMRELYDVKEPHLIEKGFLFIRLDW